MSFNIKANTREVVNALEHRVAAAFARERVRALEEIADGIIATIRRRKIWPNEKKGILKQGLWRGEVRSTQSDAEIDLGWSGQGAAFGPGHEFGFKKKKWKIAPVGIRKSPGGRDAGGRFTKGKAIGVLRWVQGGRVMYSRGHEVSAPRQLKPHFAPAAKKFPVDQRMGRALDDAVERAGL